MLPFNGSPTSLHNMLLLIMRWLDHIHFWSFGRGLKSNTPYILDSYINYSISFESNLLIFLTKVNKKYICLLQIFRARIHTENFAIPGKSFVGQSRTQTSWKIPVLLHVKGADIKLCSFCLINVLWILLLLLWTESVNNYTNINNTNKPLPISNHWTREREREREMALEIHRLIYASIQGKIACHSSWST